MLLLPALSTLLVLSAARSHLISPRSPSSNSEDLDLLPIKLLYEFPNGSWVENIAVRSNGNLLLTRNDKAELYQLDPLAAKPEAKLVHSFPGSTRLAGITEYAPDKFAVISGNVPGNSAVGPGGPGFVWRVDMSVPAATGITQATSSAVSGSTWLNGLTTLNGDAVLASDSKLGVVYKVDLKTGTAAVAVEDKETMDGSGVAGVNGVRFKNGALYYANTLKGLFVRVPLDKDGKAAGKAEVLATDVPGADDFALGPGDDEAYVVNTMLSVVYRVDFKLKKAATVVSDSKLEGPCSAQFGRAKGDERTLYIVTNGGSLLDPATATGGRVLSVKV